VHATQLITGLLTADFTARSTVRFHSSSLESSGPTRLLRRAVCASFRMIVNRSRFLARGYFFIDALGKKRQC